VKAEELAKPAPHRFHAKVHQELNEHEFDREVERERIPACIGAHGLEGHRVMETGWGRALGGKDRDGNRLHRELKNLAIRLQERAETRGGSGAVEAVGSAAAMTRRYALRPLAGMNLMALPAAWAEQRNEIRDRQGKLIGTIVHRRDGVREARDRQWRLLGTYNPKTNETRDRLGKLLTKGDTLSALVVSAETGATSKR
jgi:hypothetical protein